MIGRGGSTYMQQIRERLGNYRIQNCHAAANWGLQGERRSTYHRNYPAITRLPILNDEQFGNKFDCIRAVGAAGVPIPESVPRQQVTETGWIKKPYYSLGGRDIARLVVGEEVPNTHYMQREITNRRYEMRVHCAAWINPRDWVFQKRVHEDGDEQLTWNHHTGGSFITVNEPTDPLHDRLRETVKTIMQVLGYQFGAVDFIIQNPGERGQPLQHYFIEFNLAPGWTLDRIRDWYYSTFDALTELTVDDINFMKDGALHDGSSLFLAEQEELIEDIEEFDEAPTEEVPPQPDDGMMTMEISPNETPRQYLERMSHEFGIPLATVPEPTPESEPVEEENAYEDSMREAASESNFCHNCGRGIGTDIFGALPRFCPGCGTQVRA
jgi:hypothetical protein